MPTISNSTKLAIVKFFNVRDIARSDNRELVNELYFDRWQLAIEALEPHILPKAWFNYWCFQSIKLIKLITSYQVERLVLTHKDRLLRFGSDLIFGLCEQFGTEVIIINRSDSSESAA